MIEIELDGKKVEIAEGSMVMHAADKAGTYIPHFCYHKKLSIAANCRMCLVDVEKAPKPMPACATPVTQGMIVRTKSAKALQAQQSVMEFLLINHPLDCPICDQGGECQLQDLAVGYGGSTSRYHEEKRVVFHKDVGPLVSMQEMSRCIHCTRCVRFGQEVAGVMELGMIHRGEHAEITTVVGDTIDSELSGNMIDVCPVGALTSKPFRYSARTWELSRRKSVSPHDSTGSNLIVQVKANKVMRVVPLENEAVNECWIADRDRFSYEAVNSEHRLTTPMIKQGGEWKPVDWTAALQYVATGLAHIKAEHGAERIGALGSAHSTVEELHLLAKLVRGIGSDNIDHRVRQSDFSADSAMSGAAPVRWLGAPIASLSTLHRVLVIGSFLRKDHPLFAQRLRQAARRGSRIHSVNAVHDDWLMPMATQLTVAPSGWVRALAEIAAAVAETKQIAPPAMVGVGVVPGTEAQAIAASMMTRENKAILLGNAALQHPAAMQLMALANWIGEQVGASVGDLGAAANSVGAQLVAAQPSCGGLNAAAMLGASPSAVGALKACLLLNLEPDRDAANPSAAVAAMQGAEMVVALTSFRDAALDYADVLLPITPFTETSGTFVNAEGTAQSFHGVVKPLGEARPAWKVLRVLGNMLSLPGFDFETSEQVRTDALGEVADIAVRTAGRLSNLVAVPAERLQLLAGNGTGATGFERIADVPIYETDALVRRATSLQLTADARAVAVGIPTGLWAQLGLQDGAIVRVSQGAASAQLPARLDATLAANAVRVSSGGAHSRTLGAMFGAITVERV